MAWGRFTVIYTVRAKRDGGTSRKTKRVSGTSSAVTHHQYCPYFYPFMQPRSPHWDFLFFILTICLCSCFGFVSFGHCRKNSSRMFKATRQLRRQLKQSSLDRQQQVERRRVTMCSRPSCQAYYCNDFYCFKMSRHTPETQCMKVISFHCEQTEASLRGNRPMVWPFQ